MRRLLIIAVVLCGAFVTSVVQAATPPSLEEMAGQMLLVGFRGAQLTEDHHIVRDIREHHLGGVILFNYDVALKKTGRNILNPAQVTKLTAQLRETNTSVPGDGACDPAQMAPRLPLFIAVDQEGGRVARLSSKNGFKDYPSAKSLGKMPVARTEKAAEAMGRMIAAAGFNVDFAPVLDVDVNPECPVIGAIERSFAADPYVVATHGRAVLRGLRKSGVIGCVKHFPGHGSAKADSHKGVTDISETWIPKELIPYKELLRTKDIQLLMTGHLFNKKLDSKYPATLSRKVLTKLLRKQLGYTGVIVTDDLQMGAIAKEYGLQQTVERAVLAGADVLLFGNNLQYDPELVPTVQQIIIKMVADGKITRQRLAESYERIRTVKQGLLMAERSKDIMLFGLIRVKKSLK